MLGLFDDGEEGAEGDMQADRKSGLPDGGGAHERYEFTMEDLDTHRTYLLAVANRLLNARIRARVSPSDLVQQSILTAINQFRNFRGRSLKELRAWLEGILRNEYRNSRRTHETSQRRGIYREVPMDLLAPGGIVWDCEDVRARQAAALAEQWDRILQAVKRLSPCESEVFRLVIEERLTVREAAVKLGLTEAGARKRYERALFRLREILGWNPET